MGAADHSNTARPLAERVAIVTGSTSGIGLAIAHALAERGASVMLNGLGDAEAIDMTVQAMAMRHNVPVHFDPADMRDPAAIGRMVANTAALLGPADILVNNAGIQHVAPVESFPPDQWDAILAINLSATFHAVRAALPSMKQRGWGRIVNIASAHGLVGSAFKCAYVAAKHGVVGFTKVVALETAELGITCNAVCPGYVWTPLVERQIAAQAAAHGIPPEDVARKVFLAEQPNRRFATPLEIAETVAFLCGEFRRVHHRGSRAGRWRLDGALTPHDPQGHRKC